MQPEGPVTYECQPAALKRAVRNLLDNAVKYGKASSARIRTTARAIEIDIVDKGPGIPEPELSSVLEPFYRLEESRSCETGGVGLGLAITQSIVQAHGGTLKLAIGRLVAYAPASCFPCDRVPHAAQWLLG